MQQRRHHTVSANAVFWREGRMKQVVSLLFGVLAILLVVHNAVPASNVNELIALAKSRPGVLTFASSGTGTGTHIAAELFKSTTTVDIRHIPYKGVVAAIPDLLGGRVTMMFSPTP